MPMSGCGGANRTCWLNCGQRIRRSLHCEASGSVDGALQLEFEISKCRALPPLDAATLDSDNTDRKMSVKGYLEKWGEGGLFG